MMRKKSVVAYITLTIILSALLQIGGISPAYSDKSEIGESNKKTQDKNKEKKKKQTSGKAQFIPSEKIDAGRSVSFPVDI